MTRAMIMSVYLLLSGFFCLAAGRDTVKSKADTIPGHPFFSKFTMRQTFQDEDGKLSPASVIVSFPGNGKSDWLVDAGAAVVLGKLSDGLLTSKLVGEFHRNTSIDSKQYNWQIGYNLKVFKFKRDTLLTPLMTANAKYIRDVIDTTHSATATFNLAFYRDGDGIINLGRPAYLDSARYTYQLDPSVEVQYQQYLGSDTHTRGALIRPLLDIAASFAWNKRKEMKEITVREHGRKVRKTVIRVIRPRKILEFISSYSARYAVVNSTDNGERFSKLFKAGINLYVVSTDDSAVSIGGSYNIGSDPLNGLKEQHFWRLSMQFQF
ncbi:hypothetical protein [Mucilaginibacter kameinonensis]|uniref:hypothetical protein n=1 Tax=Mucilaginibacter kameinonensis TaxID=452286 RepID=UPI000EF7F344|nr:hypothetical protein [Mucilaginibacter kameinonensis]